ncbi:MAG: cysteine sulfinate desulfinase [Acidobacteria bacterium RIFCSPLOWO2_02_FULL_67_36]|nr:MAG: cysteine sulfinate desulfinase [Acidobacteria bacterium RIFCSPLOWO2_02_FULL_67_36]OFW20558.1 MAG: cysteine sulfinate desulfinase [Acidobacteria bacterium RIFCSPLOWO2_12_FULL_66_21]
MTPPRGEAAVRRAFDVERVRADFPILRRQVHGHPLVYLDNAATPQKPQAVLDAIVSYYTEINANVHRGVHDLSERATTAFEAAREKVRGFFNAREAREIVFTRNATESINLVAWTFGRTNVGRDDEVVVTAMEHHSNLVPWQMLCEAAGARLRVAPIDDRGELLVDELERLLGPRTKLLAVTHMSNALGTVNAVEDIVRIAHAHGVPVLIDGSQAAYHMKVDVQALDCDFYAATGHKLYGPTGIGVLYGKAALLESMPPFMGGGDMIASVTLEKSTWNVLPYKFEAGTPHIAGAIGLGAAIDYITGIGFDAIGAHEAALLAYGTEALSSVPGVRLIGTARRKASVLSFVMEGVHPHDIGTIVDREGVAIRTGHHCAQPVMARFSVPATARASLAMYNTRGEIDTLVRALERVREVFA